MLDDDSSVSDFCETEIFYQLIQAISDFFVVQKRHQLVEGTSDESRVGQWNAKIWHSAVNDCVSGSSPFSHVLGALQIIAVLPVKFSDHRCCLNVV